MMLVDQRAERTERAERDDRSRKALAEDSERSGKIVGAQERHRSRLARED